MDKLEVSKIIALFVMFVSALIFGLIPMKIRQFFLVKSKVSEKCARIGLSCCLCFGAGILFATIFLHIFPEIKNAFENLVDQGKLKQMAYPVAELIFCSGFFLIYFLEELVHLWIHHHPLGNLHAHHDSNTQEYPTKPNIISRERCESMNSVSLVNVYIHQSEASHENKLPVMDKIDPVIESNGNNRNIQMPHSKEDLETSVFRSIMVVSALSLHGCFEGLALGLETTTSGVWLFCLAICLHKVVIAFSVGMELLEVGIKPNLFYIHMIGFSAAAPVGALTGIILYGNVCSSSITGMITIASLQAISGGTILFVTFCEVLERERIKTEGRFLRFLALTLGFIAMACLQLINEINLEESDAKVNSTSSELSGQVLTHLHWFDVES